MLRPLAVHSVGQTHDNSGILAPLGLSRCDKVVYHDLGSICEISELGFPNDQGVRICDGIAILEPENAVLTQMRVADGHIVTDLLLELEFGDVSLLITYQGVPMTEGSSFHVLPGYSHFVALVKKRGKSQTLHGRPVQTIIVGEVFDSLVVDLLDGGMDVEVAWPSCNFFEQV